MGDDVKPGTVILHSEADDVVPIADSRELLRASGLPASALLLVGDDHRLADPVPLAALQSLPRTDRTAAIPAGTPHPAGSECSL